MTPKFCLFGLNFVNLSSKCDFSRRINMAPASSVHFLLISVEESVCENVILWSFGAYTFILRYIGNKQLVLDVKLGEICKSKTFHSSNGKHQRIVQTKDDEQNIKNTLLVGVGYKYNDNQYERNFIDFLDLKRVIYCVTILIDWMQDRHRNFGKISKNIGDKVRYGHSCLRVNAVSSVTDSSALSMFTFDRDGLHARFIMVLVDNRRLLWHRWMDFHNRIFQKLMDIFTVVSMDAQRLFDCLDKKKQVENPFVEKGQRDSLVWNFIHSVLSELQKIYSVLSKFWTRISENRIGATVAQS